MQGARQITVIIASLASLCQSTYAQTGAQLPALSGSYAVGTQRFEWADSSRTEIAKLSRRDSAGSIQPLPPAGARRVAVQVWYPSTRPNAALARAPYNPAGAAFAGIIGDTARLRRYREMTGRAILNGNPVKGERFPLVVFSPGGSMFAADYTLLLEDIASHGYVVAAIAHAGTSLVAFSDGAFGTESAWLPPRTLSQSLELDSLKKSWDFFRERDTYLASDIGFAMRRLLDRKWSPLSSIIDAGRVGFAGHSTGGSIATTAAMKSDVKHKAVIVYDVILPGVMFDGPLQTPFMLFRTTATNYPPGWTERLLGAFDQVRADAFDVLVEEGTHQGFSDRRLLAASDSATRTPALRELMAAAAYSVSFFDRYLKGRSQGCLADSSCEARYRVKVQRRR